MKSILLRIFLSIFLFLFVFSLTITTVSADTFQLTGNVTDSAGTLLDGVTVHVYTPGTITDVVSPTTTNGDGHYAFNTIPGGSYDVEATPPIGSNLLPAIALNAQIAADTVLNFVFAPADNVTLSGHIYDSLHNPVSNASIALTQPNSSTIVTQTTTNSSGSYSLTAAPGSYGIDIKGGANTTNLPPQFEIGTGIYSAATAYSLTETTTIDFTVPVAQVTVHVQDGSGGPVSNVQLQTNYPTQFSGLTLGGNITNGSGSTGYTNNYPLTNGSGEAVLWLIPMNYNITATPPDGSNLVPFTLNNLSITGDQREIISLQYAQITTTVIKDTITQMYNTGAITKLGSSLNDKLTQAQVSIDAGNYAQAKTTLQALINQIRAQIDIHITAAAAAILIDQINTLINSLP